jgi:hypothetical protein
MKALNKVRTKDLWQAAFMLAQGCSLAYTQEKQSQAGEKEVIFVLLGDNVYRLAREFRSGRAVCNVAALRASIIYLEEKF